MLTLEQIADANKAQFTASFGLAHNLFAHAEKLVELNVSTAKRAFEAAGAHTHKLLGATDVQSFFALQTEAAQPAAEGTQAYARDAAAIVQSAAGEITKVAQTQASITQAKFEELFESAAQNAPAGFDGVISFGKSAIEAQQRFAGYMQDAYTKNASLAASTFKQAQDSLSATAVTKTAKKK